MFSWAILCLIAFLGCAGHSNLASDGSPVCDPSATQSIVVYRPIDTPPGACAEVGRLEIAADRELRDDLSDLACDAQEAGASAVRLEVQHTSWANGPHSLRRQAVFLKCE